MGAYGACVCSEAHIRKHSQMLPIHADSGGHHCPTRLMRSRLNLKSSKRQKSVSSPPHPPGQSGSVEGVGSWLEFQCGTSSRRAKNAVEELVREVRHPVAAAHQPLTQWQMSIWSRPRFMRAGAATNSSPILSAARKLNACPYIGSAVR